MASFRIVPVLDIKNGRAVHAVKGQRDAYMPVECTWCKSGEIGALVTGYRDIFGLHDLYIADLDAIMHDKGNTKIYPDLLSIVDGKIMIDTGITSMRTFSEIAPSNFSEIILGTESIPSLSLFSDIIKTSEQDIIISLDVKNGQVLSPEVRLTNSKIQDAFHAIEDIQPHAIIFLDMSGVGARTGINPIARELASVARIPFYLGGGVRSAEDLREARAAGFSGVLVATALQAGFISPEDVARAVS